MDKKLKYIQKSFKETSKNHKMAIEYECGIFRSILFRTEDNFEGWYRIITSPNSLIITGDYGTYSFSRILDMFDFFRGTKDWPVNPSYWAEKLTSVDKISGYKQFSRDVFLENFKKFLTEILDNNEDLSKRIKNKFKKHILAEAEVVGYEEEIENLFVRYDGFDIHEYNRDVCVDLSNQLYYFREYSEDCHDYTFHYIWNLFAIIDGIDKYKKFKSKNSKNSIDNG